MMKLYLLIGKLKNGEGVISNIKHNLPQTGKLKYIQVPKEFLKEKYPHISGYTMIESIGRNIGIKTSVLRLYNFNQY
jgi:hypothetical protein